MFNDGKPDLPLPVLADLAATHFEVRGEMDSLGSERDQNISIATSGDAYVLKVANLRDDLPTLELENEIMQLAAQCELLPRVPRIVASRQHRLIETVEHAGERYAVRLLTLLPGVSARSVPSSAGLWRDVGRAAAHLTKALVGIKNDLNRPLLWDIASAPRTRPFLQYVDDLEHRELLAAVLDNAENATLPGLALLPRQWIHNDLNLNNLLVDPKRPEHVLGIIDFGDMVVEPRVVELAIAAAHQCARERNPLPTIRTMASAFHSVTPLEDTEIELIAPLISLRLTMAVLIRHARAVTSKSHFDRADYAALMGALCEMTRCSHEMAGAIHEELASTYTKSSDERLR
jgi:Ser/Thr protein kinase RdoA (MazF antagonist)